MPHFFLRPYQPADAQPAADVINAHAMRQVGIHQAAVDGAGSLRLARYFDPNAPKIIAQHPSGRVVGFAYCAGQDQAIVCAVGGGVHPDFWGQGIGSALVEWAEQQAAAISARAAPGARAVLQATLFEQDQRAQRLYARHGYQKVREWAHLVIDLAAPPPAPSLPTGLTLRAMDLDRDEDWELAGPVMDAAYANHWGALPPLDDPDENQAGGAEQDGDPPSDESYDNAPGYCFLVLDGSQAVGGILCNAKLVERPDSGRIGSLFVRPDYQRQGIGRALMLAAFNAFWQHGLKRIILDTDADSFTQAPKFYAGLGMRLYRREFVLEKEIRAGRELRRLSR